MQSEEEAAPTEAERETTATSVSADETVTTDAEGKSLPPAGNADDPALAALVPLISGSAAEITAEPQATPGTDAAAAAEAVAALSAGAPAAAVSETPAPVLTELSAGRKPVRQSAEATQARGPWKTGAAELPETAQKAVAQAVRSAVAESADAGAPVLTAERFGAEIRAAVAATHNRAPGLESALERLTTPVAQQSTAATSAPAQTLTASPVQDAATARTALPTTTVDTHLRQPGWDQALGERVLWVANQKLQGAEIKLNPAHLGPVEVRVQLHNDQAQISFTAQHAATRDALEAALPRLREMFAASGYSQVDVNVSQHSFAEQHRHAQGFEGRFQSFARNGDDGEPVAGTLPGAGRVTGLPTSAIDVFA
jgi:flagellar hook-length control protein FliK